MHISECLAFSRACGDCYPNTDNASDTDTQTVNAMPDLFAAEPDELSPASQLHSEKSEQDDEPFMDEKSEPGSPVHLQDRGTSVLQDEPDEKEPSLCGSEPDESDRWSGSDASDCPADDEMEEGVKAIVSLSYSTLSKFLSTQLCRISDNKAPPQPAKKKRCYNNSKRAAAAEQRAASKVPATQKQQRNDRVT